VKHKYNMNWQYTNDKVEENTDICSAPIPPPACTGGQCLKWAAGVFTHLANTYIETPIASNAGFWFAIYVEDAMHNVLIGHNYAWGSDYPTHTECGGTSNTTWLFNPLLNKIGWGYNYICCNQGTMNIARYLKIYIGYTTGTVEHDLKVLNTPTLKLHIKSGAIDTTITPSNMEVKNTSGLGGQKYVFYTYNIPETPMDCPIEITAIEERPTLSLTIPTSPVTPPVVIPPVVTPLPCSYPDRYFEFRYYWKQNQVSAQKYDVSLLATEDIAMGYQGGVIIDTNDYVTLEGKGTITLLDRITIDNDNVGAHANKTIKFTVNACDIPNFPIRLLIMINKVGMPDEVRVGNSYVEYNGGLFCKAEASVQMMGIKHVVESPNVYSGWSRVVILAGYSKWNGEAGWDNGMYQYSSAANFTDAALYQSGTDGLILDTNYIQ
jgi:hypothetical protein